MTTLQDTSAVTPAKDTDATVISTGTPVKRSQQRGARHVLATAGFEDEEIDYLMKCGYSSPTRIVQNFRNGYVENIQDQDVFPQGSVGLLNSVATYLIWYFDTYGSYAELESRVSEGFLDSMEVSQPSEKNGIGNQTQSPVRM